MRISDINLLDILEKEHAAGLASAFKRKRWDKGAIVSHPYQQENQVMIVASGKVRIFLSYEDKEFTLALLSRGDIYSSHTRAFVMASTDCELYVADAMAVQHKLTEIPEFTQSMVHVLGHMLKNSFNIIEGLAFKDTADRLKDLLLRHALQTGTQEDGGLSFKLDMTMEELSNVIGSSRQTASTLINELIRENLIEKRGRGHYFIPDPVQLETGKK